MTLIERLQKSKAEFIQSRREAGAAAGIDWFRERAEFPELERLSNFLEENQGELDEVFREGKSSAWSVSEDLFGVIFGDDPPDRDEADNFWSNISGDATTGRDAEWVRGFVTAAAEEFARIRHEI